MTESYLPLLEVFNRLSSSGTDFKICLSISPTLQTMLSDDLLLERYSAYLQRLENILSKEMLRTILKPHLHSLAGMYHDRLKRIRQQFEEKYAGDILSSFRQMADKGHMELITSSATHGFLPLLQRHPSSIDAQIQMARKTHQRLLDRVPSGMWLPECGFFEGLDENLSRMGIDYFFTDAHGLTLAHPAARHGVFAPILTNTKTAVFGRDLEVSKLVWSAQQGYPGHEDYREFYRDLDQEVDAEILADYLGEDLLGKTSTGIKYHRITGKTENKALYVPELAYIQALDHARDLYRRIILRLRRVKESMPHTDPVLVAPFDAELFGHWWFEGPYFLEELLRLLSQGQDDGVSLDTPSAYLSRQNDLQHASPAASSWGQGGYNSVWLNPKTDWLYNHLDWAATRMEKLARGNQTASGMKKRALNQAARELMLAQSSDWAFILKTGTSVGYAMKAIRDHILRFGKLADEIENGSIDIRHLETLEKSDNIFPDMDYTLFAD